MPVACRSLAPRILISVALACCAAGLLPAGAVHAQNAPADQKPCASCGLRDRAFADTRAVFTAPFHWDHAERRKVTRNALIVVGAMALLDKPVADYVQDRKNSTNERLANAFEPFGGRYAADVLVGYAIAGTLANRPQARATAMDGAVSSVIAAGLVVPALKEIVGRSRPNANLGEHDFNLFSGSASFPSGHTAEAFALATSVAMNTDKRWVKGLSYGVATMVGYARIEHNAHWLSDTLAGAFIGIGVARTVSHADRERPSFAVTPVAAPHGIGLMVSKAF